jgi:hypothetical protein
MGYALEEIGTGERFLHSHLIERFVRGADGELVLATKGWTRAIHCIGQWRCFAGRRKRLSSTQKLPAVCLPANQLFDLSWTHIEL